MENVLYRASQLLPTRINPLTRKSLYHLTACPHEDSHIQHVIQGYFKNPTSDLYRDSISYAQKDSIVWYYHDTELANSRDQLNIKFIESCIKEAKQNIKRRKGFLCSSEHFFEAQFVKRVFCRELYPRGSSFSRQVFLGSKFEENAPDSLYTDVRMRLQMLAITQLEERLKRDKCEGHDKLKHFTFSKECEDKLIKKGVRNKIFPILEMIAIIILSRYIPMPRFLRFK